MCGRAACLLDDSDIMVATRARAWSSNAHKTRYRPNANASPGQACAVIVSRGSSSSSSSSSSSGAKDAVLDSSSAAGAKSDRVLHLATWGISAPWGLAVNARVETVTSRGAHFRKLLDSSRVAFPVAGYYEWQREQGKTARPHFVTRAEFAEGRTYLPRAQASEKEPATLSQQTDNGNEAKAGETPSAGGVTERGGSQSEPENPGTQPAVAEQPRGVVYLAGVHDRATDTFAVLTTPVTSGMAWLHDRLPVVLEDADVSRWVGCPAPSGGEWSESEESFIARVLRPFPGGLRAHEVSKEVGDVRNRSLDLVTPLAEIRKQRIGGFFGTKPDGSPSRGALIKRKSMWDESDDDGDGGKDNGGTRAASGASSAASTPSSRMAKRPRKRASAPSSSSSAAGSQSRGKVVRGPLDAFFSAAKKG